MSLEGLQSILTKEEIVATQRANDLMERPEFVDETYRRHVRTYIPFGRQADEGENGPSVSRFERQVIKEVRQGGAVRGYITGEYGHGKTSTALYLWERARAENILAVPPFQLNKLSDLIVAGFGWTRYEIGRTRPNMLAEASELYASLMQRSAETLAHQFGMEAAAAQRLVSHRPDILELTPDDYIRFFEETTHLAQRAGFDGMLVLADELQQYIEPEIKAGTKDPISPLFDVISAILTRRNHLNFGLIMVIPPKELALLRDQRGDLVQRVLQVNLDLAAVYDRRFPERLWRRLAKEFDFEDHSERILDQECLDALGQISSRGDLADGPRTVINTFRRATQRYIELGYPPDDIYSPLHLVEDFIGGRIPYVHKIPHVVSMALSHSLVKASLQRERAIKLAAAFPNEGIPRALQERLGLASAYDDLAQSALGDIVISVGDVRNRGLTLRGLDQVAVQSDWLTTTIREFWRSYYETADATRQRAIGGFFKLLVKKVFPENQWSVSERMGEGLTRNAGLLLEGGFSSFTRRFPERRVHVRILWEDEAVKDAAPMGELVVQFRLRRFLDWPEDKRRSYAEPLRFDYSARQIDVTLNLMHREEGAISPRLEQIVGPIVSPYKLTPLLLLAMYQSIDEKRDANLVPRKDDQEIQFGFQPELLDNAFRELFSSAVGASVDASQERIVETALSRLLDAMYPDYDALIRVSNWQSSIQKYQNALKHLETAHERQGQIVVEGTKDELATLFALSNPGLDTFIANYPSLIEISREFPTRREVEQGIKGAVRFRLHSLEQRIREWLKASAEMDRVQVAGRTHEVHVIANNQIYRRASELGYREKEIDVILGLMEERGLIEQDNRRGTRRETVTQAPSVDEVAEEITTWQADISILRDAFVQSPQLAQFWDDSERARRLVEERLRVKPDDEQLIGLRRKVQTQHRQLNAFAEEKHHGLQGEVARLSTRLPVPDRRQGERLESPIQGAVDYVAQVNDLRVRLLRQYTALAGEFERLQREVQATQTALKGETLAYSMLVRLAAETKSHENKASELQKQRDAFSNLFSEFAGWADLVGDGSQLLQEIQMLGDLVREHRERFQDLSRDINGYLSANKLEALPHAPTYKMRLAEITEAVRRLRADATSRFTSLQERYQQELVNSLGYPRERLWKPLQYNPLAPDDSRSRLFSEVQSTLQTSHDMLARRIANERESVRLTVQSSALAVLPPDERQSLLTQGKDLDATLSGLAKQLTSFNDRLEDVTVVGDFPEEGEGRFRQLLLAIGRVKEQIGDLHTRVESLSRVLQALELTGEETLVLKSQPLETGAVEASDLRRIAQRLSDDDFWKALRGLQAKRRIRVVIEPVRYD